MKPLFLMPLVLVKLMTILEVGKHSMRAAPTSKWYTPKTGDTLRIPNGTCIVHYVVRANETLDSVGISAPKRGDTFHLTKRR